MVDDARELLTEAVKGKSDDEIMEFVGTMGGDEAALDTTFEGHAGRAEPRQRPGLRRRLRADRRRQDVQLHRHHQGQGSEPSRSGSPADARVTLGLAVADYLRLVAGELDGDAGVHAGEAEAQGRHDVRAAGPADVRDLEPGQDSREPPRTTPRKPCAPAGSGVLRPRSAPAEDACELTRQFLREGFKSHLIYTLHAHAHPNKPALIYEDRTPRGPSWSTASGGWRTISCRPGSDRASSVAIMLPNRPEFLEANAAAMRVGATVSFMNPRAPSADAKALVERTQASIS